MERDIRKIAREREREEYSRQGVQKGGERERER
jgi:hypothetical protein